MNPAASTRSYYPALDGLRGIAIILVLCCHNLNFLPYFEIGWVGVDLFFVLSGFLITDILLKAKANKNFLPNFYLRRILRIFPLYYTVLLLFFILAPLFRDLQVQFNYYYDQQAMSFLHMQNWLYIFNIKPDDTLLMGHFWSLSVEEQFYLLWPFVIFAVKNKRRLCIIACVILAACIISRFASWIYFGNGYTNFYFQYMTRMDGLSIGSLIAIWRINGFGYAKKKIIRLSVSIFSVHLILLILAKTILTGFPHFRLLGYTSIAVIFGIVILFAAEKRNDYSKLVLESRVLRYVGKISYGLYVFHWPVLALSKIYLLNILIDNGLGYNTAYISVSILALIIAAFLSVFSYHLFEKRILVLKDIITTDGFFTKLKRKLLLLLRPVSAR